MFGASEKRGKQVLRKGRLPLRPIQPLSGKENRVPASAKPAKSVKPSVKALKLDTKFSKFSSHPNVQKPTVASTSVSHIDATSSHKKVDENNDAVVAMLTSEEPTGLYYKLLAEQQQIALKETLDENRRLHEQVNDMKHTIKVLEEKANSAVYFSSLYTALKDEVARSVDSFGCMSKGCVDVSPRHSRHRLVPKLGRQF